MNDQNRAEEAEAEAAGLEAEQREVVAAAEVGEEVEAEVQIEAPPEEPGRYKYKKEAVFAMVAIIGIVAIAVIGLLKSNKTPAKAVQEAGVIAATPAKATETPKTVEEALVAPALVPVAPAALMTPALVPVAPVAAAKKTVALKAMEIKADPKQARVAAGKEDASKAVPAVGLSKADRLAVEQCAAEADKAIAVAKQTFASCQGEKEVCKAARDKAIGEAKTGIEVCGADVKLAATKTAADRARAAEEVKEAEERGKLLAKKLAADAAMAVAPATVSPSVAHPVPTVAAVATSINRDQLVVEACVRNLKQAGVAKGEEEERCREAKAALNL